MPPGMHRTAAQGRNGACLQIPDWRKIKTKSGRAANREAAGGRWRPSPQQATIRGADRTWLKHCEEPTS